MTKRLSQKAEEALKAAAAKGDHNARVLLALANGGGIPQGVNRLVTHGK